MLSAIISKAARTTTWQFAQEQLAKPLGFYDVVEQLIIPAFGKVRREQ